jgi:stage V sporulation protein AE
MTDRKQVIIVTDGDKTAKQAVKQAGEKLDLEVMVDSGGNPTPCSGAKLIDEINESDSSLAVVMVDDNGDLELGKGEQVLETLLDTPQLEVLGVLAVASEAKEAEGISPDLCVNRMGEIIDGPVNKQGEAEPGSHQILEGDTVDILNDFSNLLIVGIGDIGKMEGQDNPEKGAPITTQAIKVILRRSVGVNET